MNDKSQHTKLVTFAGRANPTMLSTLIVLENVERHRSVLCAQYDRCLDKALKQNWPGWSCERCTLFDQDAAAQAMRVAHEATRRPEAVF